MAVAALTQASEVLEASWIPPSVKDPERAYRKALGMEAHRQITSGSVSFTGLSGMIGFKPNGDRAVDPESDELVLVNYVFDADDSMDGAPLKEQYSGVFRQGEWALQTEANSTWIPITWPDGGIYPYVSQPPYLSMQTQPIELLLPGFDVLRARTTPGCRLFAAGSETGSGAD